MINNDRNYQRMQEQLQQNTPYSANNGNPQGANNMRPRSELASMYNRIAPQKNPSYVGGQQQGVGRYRPPTMNSPGGGWSDNGPYNYNLPNAFGSYPGYSQGNPNGMRGGPGLGQMFPQGNNNQSQMFMEYLRQMMGPNNAGNTRGRPNMFAGGPGGNPINFDVPRQGSREEMDALFGGRGGRGANAAMPQPAGRNMFDGLRQFMEQMQRGQNNKLPQQDLQANNKLPMLENQPPSLGGGGKGVAPVMNPNFDPTMVSGPSNNNGAPQVPRRIMGRRGELAAFRGSGGGFGG